MRFLYLTILALTILSCSETKMLQSSLRNFNPPIGYLHDSKIKDGPKADSLIVTLNYKPLDSLTNVSKINTKVLPFLVFNYTEANMGVRLGQGSIQQKYNEFFSNSFADESQRTGSYGISNLDSSDSLYTLEIQIDTCSTKSKYQRSTTVIFLFFAYSISYQEAGFPSETYLKVSTRLKKGNEVIAQKSYEINRIQPFLKDNNKDVRNLRADFTTNMVESLSLGTKQCIEEIINDLNSSLARKNGSATGSL